MPLLLLWRPWTGPSRPTMVRGPTESKPRQRESEEWSIADSIEQYPALSNMLNQEIESALTKAQAELKSIEEAQVNESIEHERQAHLNAGCE